MSTIFIMMIGIFLRFLAPLFLTMLILHFLKRLDDRWQAESENDQALKASDDMPCWKEQGLSIDEIKLRAEKNKQPCWQTYRLSNGFLREVCLTCEVYLAASVPVPQHSSVHL